MECYLDNAATTRPLDSVKRIIEETMVTAYGNPSSLHGKGLEAEQYVETARKRIARTLKAQPKEIIFTSGGTESNNQAIIGTALSSRRLGQHMVTTCFEHASVYKPMEFLAQMGYEITYLPVDSLGHVREEALISAIRPDTVLVSVMAVNNEVGAMQDVTRLSAIVKDRNPETLFHVDAIQAYEKVLVCPKKQGIDLLCASGHKIHGPKGSGFLYVRDGVRIKPILYGGGQQKNARSGTENVPAIAGMGQAAWELEQDFKERTENMYTLKEHFIQKLRSKVEGCVIHALQEEKMPPGDKGAFLLKEAVRRTAPHIISVGFEGIRSEVLLHALEERKIYVSSGSACSSNHPGISSTLKAIGVGREYLDGTLRFSLGVFTSKEQLDDTVECLAELVPMLRRFRRQ